MTQFTKRSPLAITIGLITLIACTALDLGSKEWALDRLAMKRTSNVPALCKADSNGYIEMQNLPKQPIVVVKNYFELRYAENCGAAFGLMNNAPPIARAIVFGIAAVGASIALCWMFVTGRGGPLFAASVPLIVSGAIGNFYERFHRGFVVDFIRWFVGEWQWPTFNIADTTISIGIALLLIESIKNDRDEDAAAKKNAESAASSTSTEAS